MKQMFDQYVAPRICEVAGAKTVIRHHVMKLFGTGESDMEALLGDRLARGRNPRIGITVSSATISLRITARGVDAAECERFIAQAHRDILSVASEYYFGDGEDFEQQHLIVDHLERVGQSLATIELGRASQLADWFSAVGSTPAYRGGLSLDGETDLCEWLDTIGHQAAARAALDRFGCDHVLVVNAYPALDARNDRPLPAAEVRFLVLTRGQEPREQILRLGGHPSILQPRIAKSALAWFRKCLDVRYPVPR
jgi:nicotinamide-nucleotide amidase